MCGWQKMPPTDWFFCRPLYVGLWASATFPQHGGQGHGWRPPVKGRGPPH